MGNPIFALMQNSGLNGWFSVIAAGASILFGIAGLIIGQLDPHEAIGYVIAGIGALGLGSKGDKIIQKLNRVEAILPPAPTNAAEGVGVPPPTE